MMTSMSARSGYYGLIAKELKNDSSLSWVDQLFRLRGVAFFMAVLISYLCQ